jgi:hypothetical protein
MTGMEPALSLPMGGMKRNAASGLFTKPSKIAARISNAREKPG